MKWIEVEVRVLEGGGEGKVGGVRKENIKKKKHGVQKMLREKEERVGKKWETKGGKCRTGKNRK